MVSRLARLSILLGLVAVALTGCRGCIRENVVYEHTFNKPDTRVKMGPVMYPEFELPPPPPSYQKGSWAPPPPPQTGAPAQGRPSREEIIDK